MTVLSSFLYTKPKSSCESLSKVTEGEEKEGRREERGGADLPDEQSIVYCELRGGS